MKKGDRIVSIIDVNANPLSSPNSDMVSALLTLGIPLNPEFGIRDYREVIDGKPTRTVVWTLEATSREGTYDTATLIENWKDPKWCAENSDHPLVYIKRAFENHHRMVEHIKTSVPIAMVRKGKHIALIPYDARPEEKKRLLDLLEK